ncbi:MAG: Rv3235 family protein, partial [Mycobacteriales bacterium]
PAHSAADSEFGRRATPSAALPNPGPVATALVRGVLEVLAGDRPARQLARFATPGLVEALEVRAGRRPSRPWAATVHSVHICRPACGVAEVSAVIETLDARHTAPSRLRWDRHRCHAMALRLEGLDGRWTLTALAMG